ncbi:TetR/AcrR family transcriptional regulator [Cryobacterium ruanii]|uniref:TetR/AcrR family transcriptional regulator n=1 Tax=Cryobacterium ruanii TaxID=1259197 RepID=A0A4R9AUL6_9MICO|nr:TetR/AcrR family transcriptional regulator [Cryobacterium ruanii]TFD68967.1 TetR/AcrR family transcriptional regulator [Cryobacterium ruanii]
MPKNAAAPSASTRDRLLDAFEELLVEGGERSATLDAVAAAAAVSKGGLLYHFASKDALIDGLLARLDTLAVEDAENIRTATAGPVDYLIRTSVHTGSPLDRAYIAGSRLAQGRDPRAMQVLTDIRRRWLSVIEDAVHDPHTAQAIMLISDGLFVNSSLAGHEQAPQLHDDEAMTRLIAVIGRLLPR